MIKILILDADGVLINAENFSKQLERDYGIPAEKWTPFFAEKFAGCLVDKADLKEEIAPYAIEMGWKGTIDELVAYWFKVEHKIDDQLVAYVQRLRQGGVKCYVATNQEKYRAQYMLNDMGFGRSFDGLYASAHLGHKKPSPEFFEALMNMLKIDDCSEVLFWDDATANIAVARECGLQAEHYANYASFVETMKTYIGEDRNV